MNKHKRQPLHVRCLEMLTKLSYSQLFALWGIMAIVFALGYFLFASIGDVSHHGPAELVAIDNPLWRFFNSLYYSIITATSTGYGDITPRGFSKALAAMQSISALFIFAVFVTKLVSHRQEIALQQVHRLTFEDVFHNIREGLFIIRKDFDQLIARSDDGVKMENEDWDTLVIAYKQAQSLINEIPDFYDGDNKLYVLDERREQLLQEAVHRTLHRINHLLDSFSRAGIAWTRHKDSLRELHELIRVVATTTPLWEEKSPYDQREAFIDIIQLKENVSGKIARTTGT